MKNSRKLESFAYCSLMILLSTIAISISFFIAACTVYPFLIFFGVMK